MLPCFLPLVRVMLSGLPTLHLLDIRLLRSDLFSSLSVVLVVAAVLQTGRMIGRMTAMLYGPGVWRWLHPAVC